MGLSSPFDLQPKSGKSTFQKALDGATHQAPPYPSPQSNKKRLNRPSHEEEDSKRPQQLTLGSAFGETEVAPGDSSVSSRTRGSKNRKRFFLGGGGSRDEVDEGVEEEEEDAMSCFSLESDLSQSSTVDTDYSRPSAASFFHSRDAASSSDTVSMMVSTPLTDTFDLRDLTLAEKESGKAPDGTSGTPTTIGAGTEVLLDDEYVRAGQEAGLMRERVKGWKGWQA